MWSMMRNTYPSVLVKSVPEGVDRVRREEYAFILDLPMAEYQTYQRPCDLYTIETFLDMRHFALALPMKSSLKHVINFEINRMKRTGELEFIYKRWWRNKCKQQRVTKHSHPKTTKRRINHTELTESVARVTAIAFVDDNKGNAGVPSVILAILLIFISLIFK